MYFLKYKEDSLVDEVVKDEKLDYVNWTSNINSFKLATKVTVVVQFRARDRRIIAFDVRKRTGNKLFWI